MRLPNRLLGPAACAAALLLAAPASGQRPVENVLVIVADDLGVGELTSYGPAPDQPNTPNLSALAAGGLSFRHCWSNPICSPTRATIQTGRYSVRTGIGNIVYRDTGALRLEEITLPEALDLGTQGAYAHAAFGKWHLGNDTVGGRLAPNLAGYSHYAGILGNLTQWDSYFNWTKVVDGQRTRTDRYATTENVDDALAWIEGAPEPWFCYLAFNAPHSPWHVPPEPLHTVDFSQEDTDRMRYQAMIEAMDTEIGRLLAGVGAERDRTNVIFLGDNGTPEPVLPEGTPYWQSKWYLYEGGVHVPLIVNGPAVQRPGTECKALVNTTDLFPTVLALAGAELTSVQPWPWERDALDLSPWLADPTLPSGREFVYAEVFKEIGFGPFEYLAVAVSDGRYKLIYSYGFWRHAEFDSEFYDLHSDPLETENLLQGPDPLTPIQRERLGALKDALVRIRS